MTFEALKNFKDMAKSLYQKIKAQGGNPIEAICDFIEKSQTPKKAKSSKPKDSSK